MEHDGRKEFVRPEGPTVKATTGPSDLTIFRAVIHDLPVVAINTRPFGPDSEGSAWDAYIWIDNANALHTEF